MIRYRTETFSGLGERDAAEVMAHETFEMGNTDILDTLEQGLLHDSEKLRSCCLDFIDYLNNSGLVPDSVLSELGFENGIAFYKEVLAEIKRVTGHDVKYALWLADKEAVTDKTFYGKYIECEDDVVAYETGPVTLSELGYDGTLYGYENYPQPYFNLN